MRFNISILTYVALALMFQVLSVLCFAGIPKKERIMVFNSVNKRINAESIDNRLLQEIIQVERKIDTINYNLFSFDKYDTLEYEIISLYQKQLQNYTGLLESKYADWGSKHGQLLNDYSDEPSYNENGQRTDKLYYVIRVHSEQIKKGATLERGDSSFFLIADISPDAEYKLINNRTKKMICSVPLLHMHTNKIMSNQILDSLTSYFEKPDNYSNTNDQNISFEIFDGKQRIDKFNFTYSHYYYPNNPMNYSVTQGDFQMDDSTVFRMKSDSLDKLVQEKKNQTCAFIKIIVNKSIATIPQAIAEAESASQKINSDISNFDLTANMNLDSLKSLVIQSSIVSERLNKVYSEWEEEHGPGQPEEFSYSKIIVDNASWWNFESDQLESFEILGYGTDLTMECFERGNRKPFLSYNLPDLKGVLSFDIEEFKSELSEYLYSEGSSFRGEFVTHVVFRIKKKNKVISTFELSLSAQVG